MKIRYNVCIYDKPTAFVLIHTVFEVYSRHSLLRFAISLTHSSKKLIAHNILKEHSVTVSSHGKKGFLVSWSKHREKKTVISYKKGISFSFKCEQVQVK